jgi:hypothetical protein
MRQKAGHQFNYFANTRNYTSLQDIARLAKPNTMQGVDTINLNEIT